MNKEDFYKLHIMQDIYFKGELKTTKFLFIDSDGICCLRFYLSDTGDRSFEWDDICKECSLEKPKEKNRYYRWMVKARDTLIMYVPDRLLDEEGRTTDGKVFFTEWDKMKKKKDESFYWEE